MFDSIELNPVTPGLFSLDDVQFPTPKKRSEWITGADADGAALTRDPLFENRTVTATVRVTATTRDAVHDGVAQLVAKCEEAEQQPDGLPLVWTPADSTDSVTFYVLSGEVGDIPVTLESGYFANSVAVPLTLTCKPAGYGTEVLAGSTGTGSTPLVSVTLANIPGDLPAEARIVVTDQATQARRDVVWGLEQRYYNSSAPPLLQASDLVTTGFAGAATVVAGSYGTGNPVGAAVAGQPTALCGTGNQPHVGTFRVRARVQAASTQVRVRLAWQNGDGPLSANTWTSPPVAGGWCEIDLGIIHIEPALLGAQRWTGRIEARTEDGTSQTIYINLLELIPAGEGYGRARAVYAYKPGSITARDDFDTFSTGNLAGRVAPLGGAWTTAGDTTDFVGLATAGSTAAKIGPYAVARGTSGETVGRYAVLGSAMTDTEVGATIFADSDAGLANNSKHGVVARYVDTQNALRAWLVPHAGQFAVSVLVANSPTTFNAPLIAPPSTAAGTGQYRIRLVAYASGSVYAVLTDAAGTVLTSVTIPAGTIAALAAGGALASGKAGLFDQGSGHTRYYNQVYASVPVTEPIVIFPSRTIEFRHDGPQRQDATGTYYGQPPAYRGARAMLPPAGDKNRTTRITVAARRNNTDTTVDGGVADATKVEVYYRPRYLADPH